MKRNESMCYINLASAMSREHVTKTDISRILNIHLNTVTAKINCETASDTTRYQIGFTFLEALIIKDTFFKNYDFRWLFEMDIENIQEKVS